MASFQPVHAQDKLAFLLSLVPYLMDHDRVSVSDAAAHFGVPVEQIRQAVRLIAVSGVPGETTQYQHDDLFDIDTEYASTDSAPVSAISAVSSHTGTRNVMGGRKARRTSVLTTVLVSSTVVLAVVAVALFVVAAVNGLF